MISRNSMLMIIAFLVGLLLVLGSFLVNSRSSVSSEWQWDQIEPIESTNENAPQERHVASNGEGGMLIGPALLSIGCSVIAAVVFAALYQSKLDEYVKTGMVADIQSSIDSGLEKHDAEVRKNQVELTPLYAFPASDSPIKKYNDLYNEELRKTASLRFKGDKALYLSYRLHELLIKRNPELILELLVPRVSLRELFEARARTLYNCSRYHDLDYTQLTSKLIRELLSSIVALYDMRHQLNFTIYFYNELPFLRYEIIDTFLIVSVLPMQKQGYYPPTLLYDRQSLFYSSFLTNFEQLKNRCPTNDVLSSTTINEHDLETLVEQSSENCTIDELRQIYQCYFQQLE